MKLSTQWKTLTRDQRRAWNAWAKTNKVLMDDGSERRVSGHKAMTMVLRNRALAGVAATPSVVPVVSGWLGPLLTALDSGAYTTPPGQLVLRANTDLIEGTRFFVWATPPVLAGEANPHALLRFVKAFNITVAVGEENFIPRFETDYRAMVGSYDGPGIEGFWETPHFIWFRVHEYVNGQLGPGQMLRATILVDA